MEAVETRLPAYARRHPVVLAPVTWVTTALLIAVFSRLLIAVGLLPAITDFLHFPLILGAAFLSALRQDRSSKIVATLVWGIAALLALALLSWAVNGGEILKPLLTWLVLAEPFLLIYALVKDPRSVQIMDRLWIIALGAVFVQIPISIWQFISFGAGDPVAGSFSKSKVVGAAALLGALVLGAKAIWQPRLAAFLLNLTGLIFLLPIPVLAGSKSVFGFFTVSGLVLLWSRRANLARNCFVAVVSVAVVYATIFAVPRFTRVFERERVYESVLRKVLAIELFAQQAADEPQAWLIGLGPGNTFSRVALLAEGGLPRSDSPVSRLRISVTPLTREAIAISLTAGFAPAATSSAYHIWSSWVGVLGDLGVMGIALYLWLWWALWRRCSQFPGWKSAFGTAAILATMLLGAWYSWLEEPGFILLVAFFLSLVIAERDDQGHGSAATRNGFLGAPY